MNQNSTSKLKAKPLSLVIGVGITILSVLLLIYGFTSKATSEVTASDPFVIYGLISLLFGIVIAINGIVLLFKKTNATEKQSNNAAVLAQAALFAALAFIGFSYFRIDISVAGGSTAFHLGNTFVVVAALLLGGSWGGLAGAIGLSLADLMSGKYFTYAPQTFFLKLFIGLIVGLVAHKVFHLTKEASKKKIFNASLIASICGLGFNVFADPFVGYFYKRYVMGLGDAALSLAKLSALTTFVNAILSVIASVILYNALRPALMKANLFVRKEQ